MMSGGWELARTRARMRRIVEVLQREPDLELWQLQERFGVTERQIQYARRKAGVPASDTRGGR